MTAWCVVLERDEVRFVFVDGWLYYYDYMIILPHLKCSPVGT